MTNRYVRSLVVWALVVAVVLFVLVPMYRSTRTVPRSIDFSEFLTLVEQGQVVGKVVFNEDNSTITGERRDGQPFRTTYSKEATLQIQALLRQKGIPFAVEAPARNSPWPNLLSSFLPLLLIIGLWFLMIRQAQSGSNQALSFGKSRARLHHESKPKVTFDDVAGVDEAKEELQEIIEFLKHPKKFQALGAKIPRGVLLVGPPGSGKTLLAKAVAGEAGVPFFSISGSEFVEMFVGVGASRVRDLFDQAKKNAPCLVFIDEIDAVGRQRGAGLGGGHDEREQTLNQLLVEMDGFDPNAGIIVIAATNRPDILDPALLRPGRFDRRIVVDNPDTKGRRAILEVHLRGKPLAEDVNVDVLAKRTPGFSGADLANLVNEAALLAARRNKRRITMAEFDEAIERVIAGPQRRSRVLSQRERELVAFHEAGHALLRKLLPHADPPHKVTIVSRGMALGYVMGMPPEDRYTRTRAELLDEITVAMGGRVAEEIVFGEVTTGAENDFEQATDMARKMVTDFGMSEKLGPMSLGKRHGPVFLGRDLVESRNYSEEVAYEIDKEVRRIIDECYGRARQILEANRDKLEVIARALLEKESLDAEELERLLAGQPLDADSPTPGALEVQAPPRTVPAPPVVPSLRPKPEAS
ncbi:MAG: ATP-dependent zinc metalloprotease FtsH [Armatimonadota bacterium]|nr:ATP-dependent zinc metalloprotease FtsH [Armatimonadota bacterium]MDR5689259.1 ATP-dependent zinc metalloprotease FtsH [Armatimonadota bacterium]MDR7389650.1 ATP-dependent zinc metalloprotease FtsH [Armatimonadota bacterium]MDR7390598.1 ATP-dependent zinc metalloprotease FtsH [Armatimonadota bacterium]MDR7394739.1 ATP-dependent zinc metalloprotease FtsH [Armatimonadota bacterium]